MCSSDLLPADARGVEAMARTIVEVVGPHVAALKPQSAFFEALGSEGFRAFERVCAYARTEGLLVIADVKRGPAPMVVLRGVLNCSFTSVSSSRMMVSTRSRERRMSRYSVISPASFCSSSVISSLVRPSFVSFRTKPPAAIFAFTVSWAQFLYPLVFTTSTDQLVLPVGIITTLIKGDVFNWGQIMTGALLGAAPPLIIYAFLMDYYIAGLTAGATKG